MLSSYLPIVILLVVVAGFAITMVTVVSDGLGPRRYNRAKLDAYECGIEPMAFSSRRPHSSGVPSNQVRSRAR